MSVRWWKYGISGMFAAMAAVRIAHASNDSVDDYGFRDIPPDSWYAQPVRIVVRAGIASGYVDEHGHKLGVFKPENPITYAEATKMILLLGKTKIVDGVPANASAVGTWAAPYIKTAEDMGISVLPSGLNVFLSISRGAAIQMLLEATGISLQETSYNPYNDLPLTHMYAKALLTATKLRLVQGDSGTRTIRPDAVINRAEMARILAFLLPSSTRVQSSIGIAASSTFSSSSSAEISVTASSSVEAEPTVSIPPQGAYITSGVNMRADPDMSARIIAQIPKMTPVKILASVGAWSKITFGDEKYVGYVVSKYIAGASQSSSASPSSAASSSLASSVAGPHIRATVKVRSDAMMSAKTVTELRANTPVTILGTIGAWTEIDLGNGKTGYVVSTFIER